MKFSPTRIINMIVIIIAVFLNYSCSKDSDLLADYVVNENAGNPGNLTDLQDGTIITYEDKMVAINILRDIQSSAARKGTILKKVTPPKNGKTEIKTDSTIVYTPNKDFTGKDDVVYVVEETAPDNTTVEKENTVTVAVNPVLETKNDQVETTADKKVVIPVLKNDTYSDKNTATVTQITTPAKGTVVINNDNTVTYTPNADATGSDTFTYTAQVENTEKTASTTNEGTVTITIDGTSTTPPTNLDLGGLAAFPGAVGFGKNATGGRGGSVIQVTNLNDSGPGSLRAALEASGTRTVVFRVGGTISLNSGIFIKNGNLTIAGQTAPGGGILIKGNVVQVEASNVIIRYIRFRSGPSAPADTDAFSITAWAGRTVENIIIDHCSFSWGIDENFNIRASDMNSSIVRNITLQNSLMSENGKNCLFYQNVQNVSVYQNMTALTNERNIRANYGFEGVFKFEMVNNLIYGWQNAATNPSNGQKYTILNNKYKTSKDISVNGDGDLIVGSSPADPGVPDSWTYAYIDGNIIPSNGFSLTASRVTPYLKSTPYATSGLTSIAYPASEIESRILDNVGASLPVRDAVDTRIINNYKNGTGTVTATGTYPNIANGTPYNDSDNDGMEDSWESANGLNPNDKSDASKDRKGDGYTNLEEFLYYMTLK